MEGSSPLVAAASDGDRSGSEGEFTGANGAAVTDGEKREEWGADGGCRCGSSSVISTSGHDWARLRLNRTRPAADTELRYLHLLWKPVKHAARRTELAGQRSHRAGWGGWEELGGTWGPLEKTCMVCAWTYTYVIYKCLYIYIYYIYIYIYRHTHTHTHTPHTSVAKIIRTLVFSATKKWF